MSKASSQSNIGPAQRTQAESFRWAALVALAAVALPLLWGALARQAALLAYPYPHDGLEGTLLYEARLLGAGQALYQPLERLRFISAPYPPLHPLMLSLAARIAGPHMFWSGRLISFVAALGVATLILLLSRRAGGAWLGGLIGAALFLSTPPVMLWAARIKPDLLALFFTALGLYLGTGTLGTTKNEGRSAKDHASVVGHWSFVLGPSSAACFALAFFTKQTAVAGPLAVGLALLVSDLRSSLSDARSPDRAGSAIPYLPIRWRTLIFSGAYLALTLGGWQLLDIVTRGQYSAHVWGLHRSDWWSQDLLLKFVALLAPYWPALLLALALPFGARSDDRALAPACYVLVAPLSLLGAAEIGANHNHLIETLLALSLAVGIVAGWAAAAIGRPDSAIHEGHQDHEDRNRRMTPMWMKSVALEANVQKRRKVVALLALALIATQLALAFRPQKWYIGELAMRDPPERYVQFMHATQGEILADDIGLLVAAGRTPRYDDPSTMGLAAASGVWDQSGLLQEIAGRRFSAIVLPVNVEKEAIDPSRRWTPEMLAAVRVHYKLAFRDTLFTYIPK